MSAVSAGVMPPAGSSRNTSGGSVVSARATSRRRRAGRGRCFASTSRSARSPTQFQHFPRPFWYRPATARRAASQQGEESTGNPAVLRGPHVFEDGHGRKQADVLKSARDSQARNPVSFPTGDVRALKGNAPAARRGTRRSRRSEAVVLPDPLGPDDAPEPLRPRPRGRCCRARPERRKRFSTFLSASMIPPREQGLQSMHPLLVKDAARHENQQYRHQAAEHDHPVALDEANRFQETDIDWRRR